MYSAPTGNFTLQWEGREGTGFLHGQLPSLSPEDISRISTNVPQTYTPGWQPLAPGFFTQHPAHLFDAAAYGNNAQRGGVPLWSVDVPDYCKANCTLGGMSDPTTLDHRVCIDAGCEGTPDLTEPPVWSSQINYITTDCTLGPEAYCQSELAFKQCNPGSTQSVATTPECDTFRPCGPIPWASIY